MQEEVRKANAKNPRVFIDIEIADVTGTKSRLTKGKKVGRITFELFENAVPRTAENFRALCTGEKVGWLPSGTGDRGRGTAAAVDVSVYACYVSSYIYMCKALFRGYFCFCGAVWCGGGDFVGARVCRNFNAGI